MPETFPIEIEAASHRYGDRLALSDVSFRVAAGEIFGLLGPNGGGKTTLFRILCGSMHPDSGSVRLGGFDVLSQPHRVRRLMGVVFQSASLDKKLTVMENLIHQGHLYGITGQRLRERIDQLLIRFGIADRARDRVETLSGGLARRVDLAKALLHEPKVLLLDEPTTGLDPQARLEFWRDLDATRRRDNISILMTTHYMGEAQRCDRVGILNAGQLIAIGSPEELKRDLPGDRLVLESETPQQLADRIGDSFDLSPRVVDGRVHIERDKAHELVADLMETFGDAIRSISVGKPTLEDVFIMKTGHGFHSTGNGEAVQSPVAEQVPRNIQGGQADG